MRKDIYIFGMVLIGVVSLTAIKNDNTFFDTISRYQYKASMAKKDIKIDETIYDNFTSKIQGINQLSNDEIIGYVYFGRDTCPICLEFNKLLQNEFDQNKDLLIYKFDTDNWRNDKSFKNILDKYNIKTVPMLIKINEDKTYKTFKSNNPEKVQAELNNFLYNK